VSPVKEKNEDSKDDRDGDDNYYVKDTHNDEDGDCLEPEIGHDADKIGE